MGLFDLLRSFSRTSVDKEVRIIILGLDNAGKTTILKKLANEDVHQVMPTQGFMVKTLKQGNFKLNMWDIGGQKSVRHYWRSYFESTGFIIYVIDSSDRRRLEETGLELQQLLDEEKLRRVPLLVFANKQDLISALGTAELSAGLNLHSIRDRIWTIVGCSAKTGEGLKEGLDFAIAKLARNKSL